MLATAPLKSPQTSPRRRLGARTQSMSRHNYSVSPRLSALSEPRRKSTSYDHPIAATRAKFLNPGDAEGDPFIRPRRRRHQIVRDASIDGRWRCIGRAATRRRQAHLCLRNYQCESGRLWHSSWRRGRRPVILAKEAARLGLFTIRQFAQGGSPYRRDVGGLQAPRPRHSWPAAFAPASASFTRRKGACHRRHGREALGLCHQQWSAGRRGCRPP